MSHRPIPLNLSHVGCILVLFLFVLASGCTIPSEDTIGHWYVSPQGDDANDCATETTPCKTIGKALDRALEDGTIHLAAGTYHETIMIAKSITITGEGAASEVIIDGESKGTVVSINCFACFVNVSLDHLTIRNGRAETGGGMSIGSASVSLASVLIRNNKANLAGGGINLQADSTLSITNSSIENNEALGIDEYSGGGGIYNLGTLTTTNVTFTENTARLWGAGLNNQGSADLTTATFTDNQLLSQGGGGAAIYNAGSLTLTSCYFQGGKAPGTTSNGGGLLNIGTAEIDGLSAYANEAGGGGAIANLEGGVLTFHNGTLSANTAFMGGGILNNGGKVSLVGVLLDHNHAKQYGGGAMNENEGILNMINVTFSENKADLNGGAIANGNPSASLAASNVTIAHNISQGGKGGGIYFLGGTVSFFNVLLADNSASNCDGEAIAGYMNLSSDASCQISGPGNLHNTDARIEALADNGGMTMTHALLPDSPAIDAGTSWATPDVDQRGVARPVDGNLDGVPRFDIGAVEFAFEAMSAPASMPIVTPTVWPLYFIPIERSSCRLGPGMMYDGLIVLPAGEPVEVEARTEDFGWFEVNLDGSNRCWVDATLGRLQFDPAWLGIGLIPPTPTYSPPTPTFTSEPALACYQYTTLETCEGHGCKWLDGGCHNP